MGGYVLDVIRKPRTPKLFLECYCIASKSQSGVSLLHTAVLWDGFCGLLQVRTHPLPPPDSDCIMQDVKLHLLNLQWFRVLRSSFSREGSSFSRFGVFVLRSSFSSASFSKLPRMVIENLIRMTIYKSRTAIFL